MTYLFKIASHDETGLTGLTVGHKYFQKQSVSKTVWPDLTKFCQIGKAFKGLWQNFEILFGIGHNFKPTFLAILCFLRNSLSCKRPNIVKKINHLVTVLENDTTIETWSKPFRRLQSFSYLGHEFQCYLVVRYLVWCINNFLSIFENGVAYC